MKTITSFDDYKETYQQSVENPEKFWAQVAETFTWKKKWDHLLQWNFTDPSVQWFQGAQLNITENCLDRHLHTRGDQLALIWEPNSPTEPNRTFTYKQLYQEVCTFANVLKRNGAKKGDRICIYLPMIPELTIAILACARIGAIHSVVFAGFSAQSISDRIQDSDCNLVITSDGSYRGEKKIPLKPVVDEALEICPSVTKVIVVKRTNDSVPMIPSRDVYLEDERALVDDQCEAIATEAEDILFILYTSGSTGKPKGVVHTCAGYMVYTEYTFRTVFQYNADPTINLKAPIYWCTADIGWITGHSYIVYGPLLSGATTLMYEGVPTFPNPGRFWRIIDKYHVSIFYTAPTAIRALQTHGAQIPQSYKLTSLKVLGTVGEPINEEAWHWYNTHIGKGNCPIVDTWWQTETGGIMISPIAGITPTKPGYATLPLPGIQPILVDSEGKELIGNDVEGNLCVKFPWPSMIRTTYGDHNRCKQAYFSTFNNLYFTGDGCKRDADGYYRITGRVDDVMNVSGHRIGTAEVENAINRHPDIVESAVVAYPHDIKGQGIYAYVISSNQIHNAELLRQEILAIVTKEIGPIAKPDKIQIVAGLPKTRSGKIMRRILRKIAEGNLNELGDTSTLLDPAIVDEIKKQRI